MRPVWLIARSVLIEAVRRKEIYVIVLLSLMVIGGVMSVNFFGMEGLTKFYREVALEVMSIACALMVVVLSCRQLPREFENRTIYPLLAKPVGRGSFLMGKLLGVLFAAGFCLSLFMLIFLIGTWYLGGEIPWIHLAEYVYLQMLAMTIISTLGFLFSLIMNLDAAITMGVLFYLTANIFTNGISYIYDFVGRVGKVIFLIVNYGIPQLTLLDFSEKTVHANIWRPLGVVTLCYLTLYAMVYIGVYFFLTMLLFRRREL